jgi:hypothetical protein
VDDYGIDRTPAVRLSCRLRGGIGNTGNPCGAMTGVLLVICIMKYGCITSEDFTAKEKTYALVQKFMTVFLRRNLSLTRTYLIGAILRIQNSWYLHRRTGGFIPDA